MSKRRIAAGLADQTIDIFIQDSSSTVGAGLTGLVYNTASLTCYYRKGATGTPTALTLATQTVGGAHSDGGFVAVDGTNCPGQYRLDLSDTIVATAGMVTLYLRGATNMVPCVLEIEVGPAPADVTHINGTTVAGTGTRVADAFVTLFNVASPVLTAASVNQTGDTYALANGANGFAALKGYVDDIGVAGAGLTAIPWNAAWDAEVQSEVEDGLNNLGFTTTVAGRIDVAVSTRLATAGYTAPDNATIGTTATAVAGLVTTIGVAGAGLTAADDAVLTAIAGLNNLSAAQVWAAASIVDGKTPAEAMKIIGAGVLGKVSGAGTDTESFYGFDGTLRAVVTADTDGNRSAVSYP